MEKKQHYNQVILKVVSEDESFCPAGVQSELAVADSSNFYLNSWEKSPPKKNPILSPVNSQI